MNDLPESLKEIMFYWGCSLECAKHIELLEKLAGAFMTEVMRAQMTAQSLALADASAHEKGPLQ